MMIVSDSDVELTSGLKCTVAQLAVDTRHTADQHSTDTISRRIASFSYGPVSLSLLRILRCASYSLIVLLSI